MELAFREKPRKGNHWGGEQGRVGAGFTLTGQSGGSGWCRAVGVLVGEEWLLFVHCWKQSLIVLTECAVTRDWWGDVT